MEFLSRRGIAYERRDISEKQEFMAQLVGMGYMGTPVTLIGDEAVVGYSPDKLNKVLRAQGFAGS